MHNISSIIPGTKIEIKLFSGIIPKEEVYDCGKYFAVLYRRRMDVIPKAEFNRLYKQMKAMYGLKLVPAYIHQRDSLDGAYFVVYVRK